MNQLFPTDTSILFLGCHLDDVEFGCGGLIARLSRQNPNLHVAVLSAANQNAAGEIQLTRDRGEAYRALRHLGLGPEQLCIGSCYGQVFDQTPQQVREELLQLRARWQPQAVFYPAHQDVHQDHSVLAANAFRIFRNVSCFGYEVIRSSFAFTPAVYVELSPQELEAKTRAVLCYESQRTQSAGYYFSEEILRSGAVFRGGQCGMPLAEAYECYRLVFPYTKEET